MPLFQTSVLKKYLAQQDKEATTKAFKKFSKYFGNTIIQQNIRESKEEQFQEGFLRELFVNVFDFTLNPNPDFNLTTEFKNQKGAKKADGAILAEGNAIGVIELKSTKTKDLEDVRKQAFDYKANQSECVYVITSNFEKLRFYINNAVEFEEFDLFHLTPDRFELLYLCLFQENILNHLPLKIKEASIQEEETITKKFYAAYSLFKRELFRDLVKNNMRNEVFRAELQTENIDRANKNIKLSLFKKSQKLIDRFLFIFFAEDRGLMPPNYSLKILENWDSLKDLDEIVLLYSRFKKAFTYLDQGRKGTDRNAEIFAYNGGLFKPDNVLDSLIISDELLYKHTQVLSKYDFESQVDVNILGHIFENSLNEIESINAEIEGQEFDKQKTKRKKDGVFYTPKYITKYIVDNTVGKLCTDKKAELNLDETEFTPNRQTATKKRLLDLLETYRTWLLQLTILDPACGSGAFLNQALDFLIREHQYLDELQTQLLGGGFVFPNIENTVLENNIYGVDLNEESVEIAKLSLWLRTAQPRRKLNDLSSNIKCGNSLIDSRSVAGDKAFHWQTEFPEIFAKGGFDVVIGNPPYGAFVSNQEKLFYKKHYTVTEYNYDTYNFFFELSLRILKNEMLLGFITPNTFLVVENGILLRNLLFKEHTLVELFETFNVFPDAVVEPINIIIRKSKPHVNSTFKTLLKDRYSDEVSERFFNHGHIYNQEKLIFNFRENEEEGFLVKKIEAKSKPLSKYASVTTGIKPYQKGKGTPKQTSDIVRDKPYSSFAEGEGWFPIVRGTQINRYLTKWDGEYVKYGEWLAEPRNPNIFFEPKILIRRTDDNLMCAFDDKNYIGINSIHSIQICVDSLEYRYLLSILNSRLCNWFFRHKNFHMVNKPLAEIKVIFVERLPILISEEQDTFIELVNRIESAILQNESVQSKFQTYFQSQFSIEKLSKKLQNWFELDFAEFIKELNNGIKTAGGGQLTKLQEMDWMEVFETKKAEALALQTQINKTDREIDQLVYQLYDLTDEEIKLVEAG